MDDTRKIGMHNLYGGYKGIHFGKKNSWFDHHKRFLKTDHPYRHNRYGFRKNAIENDELPIRPNNHQI